MDGISLDMTCEFLGKSVFEVVVTLMLIFVGEDHVAMCSFLCKCGRYAPYPFIHDEPGREKKEHLGQQCCDTKVAYLPF